MPKNLFVYGTLTFPEVVNALTGKDFPSAEATLEGYSVKKLANRAYPGLIKSAGSVAKGYVLENVDDEAVALITNWEGDEYTPIDVHALVDGKILGAGAFLYIDSDMLNEDWSRGAFHNNEDLINYVNNRIPAYLKVRKLP